MTTLDTSVVVASFASWHERHEEAVAHVAGARLIAHCAAETYSVLTRLPAPHRAPPAIVAEYLAVQFTGPWLNLPARELRRLLRRLPALGISGGGTYDAIIAATAQRADATLVSFDARAARTYDLLSVRYELC